MPDTQRETLSAFSHVIWPNSGSIYTRHYMAQYITISFLKGEVE